MSLKLIDDCDYILAREINDLQVFIMLFIKEWANTVKTPVSRSKIIERMTSNRIKPYTTINALNSLLTKGYIRRAYSEQQNKTFYVMIRNI